MVDGEEAAAAVEICQRLDGPLGTRGGGLSAKGGRHF
jgi:hypothetical protein